MLDRIHSKGILRWKQKQSKNDSEGHTVLGIRMRSNLSCKDSSFHSAVNIWRIITDRNQEMNKNLSVFVIVVIAILVYAQAAKSRGVSVPTQECLKYNRDVTGTRK